MASLLLCRTSARKYEARRAGFALFFSIWGSVWGSISSQPQQACCAERVDVLCSLQGSGFTPLLTSLVEAVEVLPKAVPHPADSCWPWDLADLPRQSLGQAGEKSAGDYLPASSKLLSKSTPCNNLEKEKSD